MKSYSRIRGVSRLTLICSFALVLAACDDGMQLPFGQTTAETPTNPTAARPTEVSGQEVEAPDVFLAEETGLWDGRPSLGGVWVAHPDVTDPERVLVTNEATGDTVVGALFRRERENPGPSFQISSDAAAALDVIAGQPTELTVVALRRQELPEIDIAVPPPEPAAEETDSPGGGDAALPSAIAATALEAINEVDEVAEVAESAAPPTLDVAAVAADAIAVTDGPEPIPQPVVALRADDIVAATSASPLPEALTNVQATSASPAPAPVPVPAPTPVAAPLPIPEAEPEPEADLAEEVAALAPTPEPEARPAAPEPLERPFIQIGIFSAEENAEGVAQSLRQGGVIPTVLDQSNDERSMWRVVVGPVPTADDRAALLETVQGLGYEDAYFVTN
ncbi:MAG: SPOR domain-containing protein [Pseudomonadota bacterium]